MKKTLVSLAIATTLIGCSDKVAEQNAAPGAAASGPAATAATAGLPAPTEVRPASIPPVLANTDHCKIDGINGVADQESTAISDRSKMSMQGWAADAVAATLPKEVFVELDGPSKQYAKAVVGGSRPDVATHFKQPSLANAGWDVVTNPAALPGGTYVLRVIQVKADGTGSICETRRAITLSAPT